jgi:nitrogenase iron protein NifH
MQRIVIFGKGGIGKSTFATNVSASLAAAGSRVLHVGCDPKHDSTVALLDGRMIEAVVDKIQRLDGIKPEDIVTRSHLGIDCVEAGGPSAGVGCGGRGISRMIEIFQAANLIDPARYDVVNYDVLGDVVCGGFAAPLRKGVGEKVVIVASEELMALYAANNIARAVVHYAPNGIALAGIVFNLKDPDADREMLERFAGRIGAKVLGYVLRDPLVREAEYRRRTVIEHAPRSAIAQSYRTLGEAMLAIAAKDCPLPTPFDEVTFYHLAQTRFIEPNGGYRVGSAAQEPLPPPEPEPETRVAQPVTLRVPESRKRDYQTELEAGKRAVWLGLLSAPEATRRLRDAFPSHASALRAEDLGT